MANDTTPTLEGLLGEVMRDPAKMAQMQALAASLGIGGASSDAPAPEAEAEPAPPAPPEPLNPGALGALMPMLQSVPRITLPERHRALLLALRPYLGVKRQEMIDAIVRLGSIGDMLGGGGS